MTWTLFCARSSMSLRVKDGRLVIVGDQSYTSTQAPIPAKTDTRCAAFVGRVHGIFAPAPQVAGGVHATPSDMTTTATARRRARRERLVEADTAKSLGVPH